MLKKRSLLFFALYLLISLTVVATSVFAQVEEDVAPKVKPSAGLTVSVDPYPFEMRLKYYFQSKRKYFFTNEQPLKLEITLRGNPEKKINIGQSDWYNAISEFYVTKYKHVYTYDKEGNKVYSDAFLSGKELRKEGTYKVKYSIIKSNYLIDGTLAPNREKRIVIEVLNRDNNFFAADNSYMFTVKFVFEEYSVAGSSEEIDILMPNLREQVMSMYRRKGDIEATEKNYPQAIKYYGKVLELEISTAGQAELYYEMSGLFEENREYEAATEAAYQALDNYGKIVVEMKEEYEGLQASEKEAMSLEEYLNKNKLLGLPTPQERKKSIRKNIKRYERKIKREKSKK